jgi:hypothetical protein
MLYVLERGGPASNKDGDTHNVSNTVVCRQQHGFRVSHFLLELEDCRLDFVNVPARARNDDQPALH